LVCYYRADSGLLRVMSMKRLWWLLPVLLVTAWWLAERWQISTDQRLSPDAGCDVAAEPCSLALPGGDQLRLSLSPRPPLLMKPMAVEVVLEGQASRIWIDLVGLNMDMGPNRQELVRSGPGLWQGEVIIPICSAAEMQWEARVMVVRDGRTIVAPFPFTTRP
jgi:hypothetical protein